MYLPWIMLQQFKALYFMRSCKSKGKKTNNSMENIGTKEKDRKFTQKREETAKNMSNIWTPSK
jgi:hypothetical protein